MPPMTTTPDAAASGRAGWWRWLPLLCVVATLAALYGFGAADYLSPGRIAAYRAQLSGMVARHALVSALVYLAVYAAAVAVSFPGASVLTLVGGALFGVVPGTLLSAFAATGGATAIFLIARTSLGDFFATRAGPRLQNMRRGFAEDAFNYLLFLRLAPMFPFWIVNLAAAFFGMRTGPYVVATAIGILPGTFVFSYLGRNLDSALDRDAPLLSPTLAFALALLAGMALVPVIVRRLRSARPARGDPESL